MSSIRWTLFLIYSVIAPLMLASCLTTPETPDTTPSIPTISILIIQDGHDDSTNLKVAPNPANKQVILLPEAIGMEEDATGKLTIFDTQGRLKCEQPVSMNQAIQLDVSTWSRGVYFVRMQTAKEQVTKPLILIE